MPKRNNFKHQTHSDQPPKAPYAILQAELPSAPSSPEFKSVSGKFAERIFGKVDAVYFSHGTFAGNDPLGWIAQFERSIPSSGSPLRELGKKLTDAITKDSGNFMDDFLELFPLEIPTRKFTWSGENTHTGRCQAAIKLLAVLFERIETEPRVLLWSHSHGGNVSALITNLLGADEWARNQFFDLMWPFFPSAENNELVKVQNSLEDESIRSRLKIDVVNFGTPICYGWDTSGYSQLMHVVHHKLSSGIPDYLSPALSLAGDGIAGDVAQLIGITGSNFWPYLLSETTRETEKKVHEFLAPELTRKNYLQRFRLGMRVAEEGTTLLVDYDNANGWAKELAGHAIYTRKDWLAFHLDLVGARFYGS
jgi:hypothetical protein